MAFLQGLKDFFLGTPADIQSVNRFSPQEQQARSGLFNRLQDPYAGFQPIANKARSSFSQNTVPSLAERFTSLGSNATSSPAFGQELGQAGAGLEEALAALQAQYGQQSIGQLLQLLSNPENQNFQTPGSEGLLQYAGRGLVDAASAYATGGLSALGKQHAEQRAKRQVTPEEFYGRGQPQQFQNPTFGATSQPGFLPNGLPSNYANFGDRFASSGMNALDAYRGY